LTPRNYLSISELKKVEIKEKTEEDYKYCDVSNHVEDHLHK